MKCSAYPTVLTIKNIICMQKNRERSFRTYGIFLNARRSTSDMANPAEMFGEVWEINLDLGTCRIQIRFVSNSSKCELNAKFIVISLLPIFRIFRSKHIASATRDYRNIMNILNVGVLVEELTP